MAKKKKSKDKKRKTTPKEKPSLTHLENELLNQTIADLENRIEWRSELCDIVKEDIKQYEKAYELEHQDKRDAVDVLEKAIEEYSVMNLKLKSNIPDAESLKTQAEQIRSCDMASRVFAINKEKLSNETELQLLRKKVADLESYDVQFIENKIGKLEEELSEGASQEYLQDERMDKILRAEMQEIYNKKMSSYQDQLKMKMNKNLERIIEETRWWRNSWNILQNKLNNLKQSNLTKATDMDKIREDLKVQKQSNLLDFAELYKLNKNVAILDEYAKSYRNASKYDCDMKHAELLDKSIENYESLLKERQLDLKNCRELLELNESNIKELESELLKANNFGDDLLSIIQQVVALIEKEVKYVLERNYGDPSEKNNTLLELDCLFAKASKIIYENMQQMY